MGFRSIVNRKSSLRKLNDRIEFSRMIPQEACLAGLLKPPSLCREVASQAGPSFPRWAHPSLQWQIDI